jgi:hypothetical protein
MFGIVFCNVIKADYGGYLAMGKNTASCAMPIVGYTLNYYW